MMKSERGFTLVEVLASMTILFIILISFLTIFAQSATFTRTNEDSLQATNLADRAMEVLRASQSADIDKLRDHLEDADLISAGCQVDELTSIGCQSEVSEEPLAIKLTPSPPETELRIRHVRLDVLQKDRVNPVVATRHFYLIIKPNK